MLLPEQIGKLNLLSEYISLRRTTQLEISRATGVHQSQISRILSGGVRRASKNVIRLCKYADSLPSITRRTKDDQEAVASELMSLLGRSAAEDDALRQIISGLQAWRRACLSDR